MKKLILIIAVLIAVHYRGQLGEIFNSEYEDEVHSYSNYLSTFELEDTKANYDNYLKCIEMGLF